jgi:hypothetical protein
MDWVSKVDAQNIWVTAIPSLCGELKRTINFGSLDLRNGMALKFLEFVEEEYIWEDLPRVWLKIISLPNGIPNLRGHPLGYWHNIWCDHSGGYDHY